MFKLLISYTWFELQGLSCAWSITAFVKGGHQKADITLLNTSGFNVAFQHAIYVCNNSSQCLHNHHI